MRYLGIDWGHRRLGLALSDRDGLIASPYRVLTLAVAADVSALVGAIVREEEVGEVVVGLPYKLDGTDSLSTIQARKLAARLRQVLSLPVSTWDERLTSRAAEAALLEGDLSRKRRRQVIDKVAAAIMLQSYLNARKGETP